MHGRASQTHGMNNLSSKPTDASVWRRFWFFDACIEAPPPDAAREELSDLRRRNNHWLRAHAPTYLLRWSFLCLFALFLLGLTSGDEDVPLIFRVMAGGFVGFALGFLLRHARVYWSAVSSLRQPLGEPGSRR